MTKDQGGKIAHVVTFVEETEGQFEEINDSRPWQLTEQVHPRDTDHFFFHMVVYVRKQGKL